MNDEKTRFSINFKILFHHACFADCSDCESEAYYGVRDAEEAYNSSDLDDCQDYARKAYRHFSFAESYAQDCYCDVAGSEAYDAYRDAKKAYNAFDLYDCQDYVRKAIRHGRDAESEASYCD